MTDRLIRTTTALAVVAVAVVAAIISYQHAYELVRSRGLRRGQLEQADQAGVDIKKFRLRWGPEREPYQGVGRAGVGGQVGGQRPGNTRQPGRSQPHRAPVLRGQAGQHGGQLILAQPGQPQLSSHAQRQHRRDDHGGVGGCRPGGDRLQQPQRRGPAMINVVDHQQPAVPAAEHAGGGIQRRRASVAEHPRGQFVGRAGVGQQPGPCQRTRLTGHRGGAQHREAAAGALPCRGGRKLGAARARPPGDGQHAATAVGRTVEYAPNLGHLAAPPGKYHNATYTATPARWHACGLTERFVRCWFTPPGYRAEGDQS